MNTKTDTDGMPTRSNPQELADLVKHTANRVDQLYGDVIDLVDEPYDAFKLGAAIAATVLNRFGHTIDEVMPAGLMDMPTKSKKHHAWIDCLNALSQPLDQLSPRERIILKILEACIRAEYSKAAPKKDAFTAMFETILRDLKA
jgi:hypothetical protein